jgi:hypothetical protein
MARSLDVHTSLYMLKGIKRDPHCCRMQLASADGIFAFRIGSRYGPVFWVV